ncbi:MAG: LysR family transcriptional regulator [Acidobacteria bacterium]|nr:LysR family transcriptional regulator [Acidobacteriota bacterium]MCB9396668.1 LysR family transcriptional regulator [Acidobacteriota bacterium]
MIEDLVLFRKVVECGSFVQAARVTDRAPAQITRAVQRLEGQLHCQLLLRTTRKVQVSEAGWRLYALGGDLLDSHQQLLLSFSEQGPIQGQLKLALPVSFGRKVVLPMVLEWMNQNPAVRLNLHFSDEHQALLSQGFDLAIRITSQLSGPLQARKLMANTRVLLASPRYLDRMGTPRQPQALTEHACLCLSQEPHWLFKAGGKELEVAVSGPLDSNHGEALGTACLSGLGIALRSLWDVAPYLATGELVQVLSDYEVGPQMAVYALYPQTRYPSRAQRSLLDHLAFCFKRFEDLGYSAH